MKLFDINTAIGHWPFQQVRNNTSTKLRKLLESKGISGAAVAHTHGVFYKNCHDANGELAAEISKHRDFFTGIATINPTYPGWERDLQECVEAFGFKALRLLPLYHNYSLKSAEASAIIAAAGKMKIPVIIPACIFNFRQMHWMDIPRALELDDLKEVLLGNPDTRFVLTEGAVPVSQLADPSGKSLFKNLYIEMSRYRSAYGGVLSNLIRTIGADHVLFGSGAPFKEITPALMKLDNAEGSVAEKTQMTSGNFKKLLNL
ncbi:MAG: amidohydrolase family protein [Verrucomicrobia bacterium]|nr:amidohydrolase family protein [Verrucomicrobiota bacterium]